MANPFRDMSVFMQSLVAVAVAVVIALLGLYVPFSPVYTTREDLDRAVAERTQLSTEVSQLQVYKQRYGELKQQMDALQKQLETLKTIVPEEKEADEFIRLLQGAAAAATVQVRRIAAKPVAAKQIYNEMPFEIDVDGSYFNILDFFTRLSRLSRIINVGDLKFSDVEKKGKYVLRPGTTVIGTLTVVTFFSKPAETATTGAGPAGGPGAGAVPRPAGTPGGPPMGAPPPPPARP